MLTNRLFALACCCLVWGCTQDSQDPSDSTQLTKEEAKRMQGGKSDSGEDLCGKWGWYGDGECDLFCSNMDPDCLETSCPDSNDPAVHYLSQDPLKCQAMMFQCEEGQEQFINECGCGCLDVTTPPACPDPTDPAVHYIGNSHEDVSVCWVVKFSCEQNQTLFTDACGCGCIDEQACPDPTDPTVHYMDGTHENPAACFAMLFQCDEGQELFSNSCGCGCMDKPTDCPDPNDPKVHYMEGTHENPAACFAMLFQCDEGQESFSNLCGCGCIDGT